MYEFLDRLVTIALPRVRDFRGIPGGKGFDGRGNFAMGLKEQIIFPEIVYDKVDAIRGMDIIFVTTAKTDAEAKALLKGLQSAVREVSGWLVEYFWKTAGVDRQVPEGCRRWLRHRRSTAMASVSAWRPVTRANARR